MRLLVGPAMSWVLDFSLQGHRVRLSAGYNGGTPGTALDDNARQHRHYEHTNTAGAICALLRPQDPHFCGKRLHPSTLPSLSKARRLLWLLYTAVWYGLGIPAACSR